MEFLWGNPFSTAVGQRIESATSSSLPSEDWTLNMDICDIINSLEDGPKDAVRALRKRIVGNKNFKEVMLALSVLETCVKNCGYRFHILVTTRDFIEGVLVRSIIPRNNPPLIVHDRVLGIIQAWADAFRSSPDLTGVVSVYEDLRRKGLEFPVTELDAHIAAQNPKQTLSQNGSAVTTLPAAFLSSKPLLTPPQTSELKKIVEGTNGFSPSQVKQLKTELGVVRSNLTTMSDLMTQLDPVTVKQADMELLQQLYTVCKEMQERIVTVVPRLSEEKLIQELLETNDQMNSTFNHYHRFERQLTNGQHAAEKHTYVNLAELDLTARSQESGVASVTSDSLSSHFTKLSTSESEEALSPQIHTSTGQTPSDRGEDGVDGHAHARLSSLQATGTIPVSQSDVMDDIEQWLALDDEYEDVDDGVTSEEFDKFLAERAKAAERLPSLRSSSQDISHSES
ncbi:target of Myb1 membrane trafficking protein isoform X6 [Cynoglossus semilaevis]|uniref:target of Myb1 membrane trafficking protein isoform X6 n=1 Tax=Cynoglossus semilaevis TaxID=244447 RepID=UPI0007DC92C1|nr:target of Myb protein 1 isoform X6 [Cynoglossus semilaevis]